MPATWTEFEKKIGELGGENADVVKALGGAVKALGEATKDNVEALGKSLKDFQDTLTAAKDSGDKSGVKVDELDKKATEFLTRFEAMQKAENEVKGRLNVLEALGQRLPSGDAPADEKKFEAAGALQRTALAHQGVKFDPIMQRDKVDVKRHDAHVEAMKNLILYGHDALTPEQRKDIYQVGANPNAGIFVTSEIDTAIIQAATEFTNILALATVKTLRTGDAYEARDRYNRVTGRWVGATEAPQRTGTVKTGNIRIDANEMELMPVATQTQLSDWAECEAFLIEDAGEEFGFMLGTAAVTGDGIKKPRGLLTYPNGTGKGKIEQIDVGASGADFPGITKLIYGVKSVYLRNARFMLKRTGMASLMQIQDGDGRYIFAGNLAGGFPMTLAGYPIELSDDMPAVAGGALSYIFGDIAKAYTVVLKEGMLLIRDDLTQKPEVEFLMRKRAGGDVAMFEAIVIGKCA